MLNKNKNYAVFSNSRAQITSLLMSKMNLWQFNCKINVHNAPVTVRLQDQCQI